MRRDGSAGAAQVRGQSSPQGAEGIRQKGRGKDRLDDTLALMHAVLWGRPGVVVGGAVDMARHDGCRQDVGRRGRGGFDVPEQHGH